MEPNQIQPQSPQLKSSRTYEEWKAALIKIVERHYGHSRTEIKDEQVKSYYDRALMPDVCFKEIFNH